MAFPTTMGMNGALPRGEALRVALRIGLVEAGPQLAISGEWRPVWWALSEFGWLDTALLEAVGRGLAASVPGRRQVRVLCDAGWLARNRPPGRPARPVRLTPRGVQALDEFPVGAPPWTAPDREVARRALAGAMPRHGQQDVPALCCSAAEVAASWSRLVREVDVRGVVQEWRRAGWLTDLVRPPGRRVLTGYGRRCARAVATATGTAAPRQPRRQDQEHDQLLTNAVLRLLKPWPGLAGMLRVARRCHLPTPEGTGWIIPDALVGFHREERLFLLAIETERRGRYDNLARHIHRLRQLAELLPEDTVHIAVLCARRSPGRINVLAKALAEPGSAARIRAAVTTPGTLSDQLARWGIDRHAEPVSPRW